MTTHGRQIRSAERNALVAVMIASAISIFAWWHGRPTPRSVKLPSAAEIESIEVAIWGEQIGRKDVINCAVDKSDFDLVLRCLSPSVISDEARGMLRLPRLGELTIRTQNGRTYRVVFVDAGKNPLCFSLDGVACIRGGPSYQGYEEDHRELYGIDAPHIDESWAFADRLIGICGSEVDGHSDAVLEVLKSDQVK